MPSIKKIFNEKLVKYCSKAYKYKNYIFWGQTSFLIGISLLPSALPISVFFLLISIIISLTKNIKILFVDKWNLYLLFISFLMIFSSFYKIFTINNEELVHIIQGSWIDLFNWLPLFLFFYAFQMYLTTSKQRILFCKALIIGSVPVVFSCLTQYFFEWYGPYSTFFGLITWYQKPFENPESGITGLFNNPNYTSYWLSTILPFSFFLFAKNKSNKYKFFLYLFSSFLILYLLIQTSSRNGLISISLSTLLIFSSKIVISTLILCFSILIILFFSQSLLPFEMISIVDSVIPSKLINKIFSISEINLNYLHRFDTYKNAILFIFEKPLFGWGASTFAILYYLKSGLSPTTHTHNIFLEVAHNYGLIISLLFTIFIANLIFKSFKLIKYQKNNKIVNINNFWITSAICSVIFHLNDIPYYDGKINLLFWILLSGLKCIIDEKIEKYS